MVVYNKDDIKNIVEDFLAEYLHLDSINLSSKLVYKLYEILSLYGIEVENIQSNKD